MELYSNIFGEGKPFLILHGFLGMSDNWKTLAKKIEEQGYEMHLIDQRNHGRSSHSDDFDYQLMADDINEYCIDKGLNDVILLGHSMGGKVAMNFAKKYPSKLHKLLIADIGPKYYPLHHQDILDGLVSLDFEELKTRTAVDNALSMYVPDAGVRMFLMKNLFWKEKGILGLRMNIVSLINNSSEIGKALPEGIAYEKEVLFLKGEKSNYILKEDEAGIKAQFPYAEIVEISNAGHWLHVENSADFLVAVLGFVKN